MMKVILESALAQGDFEKVKENCTKYERRNITLEQAGNVMAWARNYLQNRMCEEAEMIDKLRIPLYKEKTAAEKWIDEQ
jgi:alpha-amylase/alpha-mannosidase (GH57 family)